MGFKETYLAKKAERAQFIAALNPKSFDFQLATWFGSGLIIPAPGTWGTIGGMIFGLVLGFFTNGFFIFLTSILLFWLGFQSVKRLEEKLNDHDPSFIVIDEVSAILLVMSFHSLIIGWLYSVNITGIFPALVHIIGFGLFRYFDAKKPGYIGILDQKLKGAWGVMLDDTLAAIYTIFTSLIIFFAIYLLSFLGM